MAIASKKKPGRGPVRATRKRKRSRPKWLVPVAVVSVVLIVGGLVLSQVTKTTNRPEYQIASGENVPISKTGLTSAQNSPMLLRNPKDANNLVVADRIDRPLRSGILHVSRDGGRTYKDVSLKLPPGDALGFAPEIAFDNNGRLTVAFMTVPPGEAIPNGAWVESSTDGGETLSNPTTVAGPLAFQLRLAANPADGRLYVTWLQAEDAAVPRDATCVPCFSRTGLPIMAKSSADGGQTWSAATRVSDQARARVGAATPAVGPDGSVYVLYQDFKDDKDDWENLGTPPYKGNYELVLAKSIDQGQSFSPGTVVDAELRTLERFLVFFPKYPSLAVSPKGEVFVGWQDARNGDFDVLLRRSSDGGSTWKGPFRVNDDPLGNGRYQYLPTVSASIEGRVDVVYYDRRDDPRNILTGAYFATSFNGGNDWQSVPASDRLFDSRIGPGSGRRTPDAGARLGLVSEPDGAFAAWTDSREGSLDTDRQDILGARITIAKKS